LRSTLERFGIPARFYFDSDLEKHSVARLLTGAVDAMLGGWDHAETLAVLRLAPMFAASENLDRLDHAVREQIPNSGMDWLQTLVMALPEPGSIAKLLESLAALEEWRALWLSPQDWAQRLRALRGLFHPAVTEDPGAWPSRALEWRSQAV